MTGNRRRTRQFVRSLIQTRFSGKNIVPKYSPIYCHGRCNPKIILKDFLNTHIKLVKPLTSISGSEGPYAYSDERNKQVSDTCTLFVFVACVECQTGVMQFLTLLHSERPKLHTILAFLSVIELIWSHAEQ